MDGMNKASVIDLGSNSVKLANYNVDSKDSYKPYHQESVRIKLAEGLVNGALGEKHMWQTIDILKFFRNIIDFEDINYVLSVATSAVREASNRDSFLSTILHETGFNFKVLSEHEEALYSYAGAIRSLNLPNVVFFDIGGGSLELVSSKNFEINKTISVPLGALKLSQSFTTLGRSSDTIKEMIQYIEANLPDRETLGIDHSDGLVLVGVGGTVRTLAKYDQASMSYPLKKLHNYQMPFDSVTKLSNELHSMTIEQIAQIDSIGNGRSDTIQAGAAVISTLMNKLEFDSLTVSAQGLREGTLALSLQYPNEFTKHMINETHVQDLVRLYSQPDAVLKHIDDLVRIFFTINLISDEERDILVRATLQIDKLSSFRTVDSVFYAILDDDSNLSHRQQLIVALSIIYVKKKNQADILFDEFAQILGPSDKKMIKKISSIVSLCDILYKTGTLVRSKSVGTMLSLDVYSANNKFPERLFAKACSKMSDSVGIRIDSSVYYDVPNRVKSVDII